MRTLISLAIVASLMSGCTVAGAIIGGASASNRNPHPSEAHREKRSAGESALIGAGIGLALDVVVVGALIMSSGGGYPSTLVSREAPMR